MYKTQNDPCSCNPILGRSIAPRQSKHVDHAVPADDKNSAKLTAHPVTGETWIGSAGRCGPSIPFKIIIMPHCRRLLHRRILWSSSSSLFFVLSIGTPPQLRRMRRWYHALSLEVFSERVELCYIALPHLFPLRAAPITDHEEYHNLTSSLFPLFPHVCGVSFCVHNWFEFGVVEMAWSPVGGIICS